MSAPLLLSTPSRRDGAASSVLRVATAAALALVAMCAATAPAHAAPITIEWVTVGNPGNTSDPATGSVYGAVANEYRIMKFEFTNTQYTTFLNAIDPDGSNPNSVYSLFMGANARGGISFTSGNNAGTKYAVRSNMGDKPVNYVSWFDAARVANWLHNGAQTYGITDATANAPQNTGAYTVGTGTSGNAVAVNSGALFSIPTENEWYKAAFYNPTLNSGSGGYAEYGNGFSASAPTAVTAGTTGIGSAGGTGNFANYSTAGGWNSQTGNVTTVGTNGGPSYYGAFDMSGNTREWNDLTGAADSTRGIRGGSWSGNAFGLSSSSRNAISLSTENSDGGFRLAAVPEPSTWAMALTGLAFAGWAMRRRALRRCGRSINIAASLSLAAAFLSADPAHAAPITIDWVTVGDPGNAADTTGSPNPAGDVVDSFRIMKFEFTNQQYTAFLNSVAATDPYALYNDNMGSNDLGGITRSGSSGSYSYSVRSNMGDKPVNYVSWFDAARVANWLMNGTMSSSSTETGAYTLLGSYTIGSTAPAKNPGAQFYIPTETEWYKAAYYKGGSTNAGYWDYATQSDTAPTAVTAGPTGIGSAGSTGNFANYNRGADWNGQDGNVTTVGTNGGASSYGAFDMSGNVWEWNDLAGGAGTSRGRRGGDFSISSAAWLSSANRTTNDAANDYSNSGFRLASSVAVPEPSTYAMALAGLACGGWMMRPRKRRSLSRTNAIASAFAIVAAFFGAWPARAAPIAIDWVTVGDPGNTADTNPSGYGVVANEFLIMKYEFTNQQYTAFLNSVAKTDPYSLYNTLMGTDARGGITRSGSLGSFTYSVRANMGDKPVNFVSWFDAARVSNWLMNGATGTSSTETGAYTLVGGQTTGTAPARNSGATFYIPTENQWYKAAYYKGGSTNAGYWDYATQTNTAPTAVTAGTTGIGSAGSTGNFANYNRGSDWNSQDGNATTVGTNGGPSAYGAFDMSGNVFEWNDLTGTAGVSRGLRGGSWADSAVGVSSSNRTVGGASGGDVEDVGFRLAAVPEPSTYAMALAGLACGGWMMRRRKQAGGPCWPFGS